MIRFIILVSLVLASCAHKHEALKTEASSKGYLFRIGSPEVHTGDQVMIYKMICSGTRAVGKTSVKNCSKKKIGEGVVGEVVNADSAFVRPSSEIVMEPELLVEKE